MSREARDTAGEAPALPGGPRWARLFETLSKHLDAERSELSYADLATSLGMAESMVRKQLHNLRQRYRWLLRDEVAHTVQNPADVDDEIRHLGAVLAAGSEL